jgi:hypothetical protein
LIAINENGGKGWRLPPKFLTGSIIRDFLAENKLAER